MDRMWQHTTRMASQTVSLLPKFKQPHFRLYTHKQCSMLQLCVAAKLNPERLPVGTTTVHVCEPLNMALAIPMPKASPSHACTVQLGPGELTGHADWGANRCHVGA